MPKWEPVYYVGSDGRVHRPAGPDRAWCHASRKLQEMEGPYRRPPQHAKRPCGWCFQGEWVPLPVLYQPTGTGWPTVRAS